MSIFSKIATLFAHDLDNESGLAKKRNAQNIDAKQLAAAALMVEVAVQDGEFVEIERQVIEKLLVEKLNLSHDDALELLSKAVDKQENSIQILSFTKDIKNHFDEEGRADIMELLWWVVFADGQEDNYERNLMRRIAGLLYISDKKSGEIRKNVMLDNNVS